MKQVEIEFKNMLTQMEYERLLHFFAVQPEQIITLRNDYFDTADFSIKKLQSALRIRETSQYIECTLKEADTANRSIETTIPLSAVEAQQMRNTGIPPLPIKKHLQSKGVDPTTIACFGSLTTERVELPYHGGTLVLDHTFYLQKEDFEVEYEAADEKIGATIFSEFLHKQQIPKRATDKKIARFNYALHAQKG